MNREEQFIQEINNQINKKDQTWIERNQKGEITKIILNYTQIKTIPKYIGELTSLETLDLRETPITELPNGVFKLIAENVLQRLLFGKDSSNRIGKLANGTLYQLNFDDTNISTIPESIGQLITLKSLNLYKTKITALPESIKYLVELEYLELTGSKIETLPDSIGQLRSLRNLFLSETNIKSLPTSIGQLNNLQNLYLRHDPITLLPESIGLLKKLQILDLRKSSINTLPTSIGQLTSLEVLDLCGTSITTLPETIGELTSLKILNLEETAIKFLPNSLGQLNKLEYLYVFEHLISYPPPIIIRKGIKAIRKYFQQMDDLLPKLISKIHKGKPLTFEERTYPYLMKWAPQLETVCLQEPESPTAKEILQLIKERGFINLKEDSNLWL